MPRNATPKDLSLKSLELFQICALQGSLEAAAKETGLSISTVSHHLRNLEAHLGVDLFNHTRRPMVLTPKGHAFLRNIEDALQTIRKAKAEASAGNIAEASYLRIGTIEDFDSDIIPDLAVFLSGAMPSCDVLFQTETSQTILDMLRARHLDLGITTAPDERLRDLQGKALLRDPYVVVLPRDAGPSTQDILGGTSPLPFLRFAPDLIIARQIDAQMRRIGLKVPSSFACNNNQTLMAMVAAGAGWTITTPLLYARARRFQPKLAMHPFPGKRFARTLALVATPDCSRSVQDLIDTRLRALLRTHVIAPLHRQYPWLKDSCDLVD